MSLSLLHLPSLDLVRGFVAVGRRMSITQAAQDLCLTQSAVSRQVAALEAQLGVRLLLRGHRSIAFTPEGERLFRSADGALQQLQDVLGSLSTRGAPRPVTLSASIGVTGLWLLPRLSRLQQRHPAVDLRVSANNRLADLRSDGIDLAIRYAPAEAVPEGARWLFGETVAPVISPALVGRPIATAQELQGLKLLEFDDPRHPWLQWQGWAAALGWRPLQPQGVLRFNQYDQVIQAALAGQGVALGRLELIRPLLADGRLVLAAQSHCTVRAGHAFWLLQAQPQPSDDVRRVAAWIEAEAEAEAAGALP
ncbi:MAG: LysR substrate-binding domain-containing protein [Acidovorax sp.]|uniref:LysR substrate-binding domain-containing protein n=1 Tax=Acidovorax sp. TaxID=1872122 RepID=UPI0025BF2E5D|nr:LysR substrate-binding domain-containing protein [Acidovorax sp.]MCE1193903.1 LysR substrate-binding domain-containing protein [Acidovorax sp.]